MKKILAVQICAFILVSGALGGLLYYSPVYSDVQSRIVSVLCLSCIKLDPKTHLEGTFETATGGAHSDFVLDNLTKGPVFLAYRTDVCAACDEMEPIVQDIFNVEFEKEESFAETVSFNGTNVTFVHINTDHASEEFRESFLIYDKDYIRGVPMFTVITIEYDHGFIRPYYFTVYGTLTLDSDEDRKEFLQNMIIDGINLYNRNKEGYPID